MKLTLRQLPLHLQQNLLPVYLITGAELALVDEAKKMLRDAAVKKGYLQRNILHDEIPTGFLQLKEMFENFSLFNEPKLIEMHLASGKWDEPSFSILEHYLQHAPEDQRLIFLAPKLSGAQQKSRWYQLIEKHGAVITIWPLEGLDLQQWLSRELQKQRLSITPAALKIFAEKTEGNLSAAQQIILQLALLYAKESIDEKKLETVLTDCARFTVYDLVNASLLGEIDRSFRILNELREAHTEPSSILWALLHEMQLVYELIHQQKTEPLEHLLAKQWMSKRKFLKAAVSRFTEKQIAEIFSVGLTVDEIIKGAKPGNVWNQLEKIVLVCQPEQD